MKLLTHRDSSRHTGTCTTFAKGKRVCKMFKTQLIVPFFFEEDTIRQDNILDMLKNFVYPQLRIGYRIWFSCLMVYLLTGDWTCAPFWTHSSPIVRSAETGIQHGRHVLRNNSTFFYDALWRMKVRVNTFHVNDTDELKHKNQQSLHTCYKWHTW